MNKRLSVFAVILIVIGFVGTISSSVSTLSNIDDVIINVKDYQKELGWYEEKEIYNKKIESSKLIINTMDTDVEINYHEKDYVNIHKVGSVSHSTYEISEVDNVLEITENENNKNFNDVESIKESINIGMSELFNNGDRKIVINLPDKYDIEVNSNYGTLRIRNLKVLNKELIFNTIQGYINLPIDIKNMENMKINTKGHIYFDPEELKGINNIDIKADSLDILDNKEYMINNSVIDNIPKNINIETIKTSDKYSDIYVESVLPIAKNLNISNNEGSVSVTLPITEYNTNFDIKSSTSTISIQGENKDYKSYSGAIYNVEGEEYKVNIESNGTISIN